MMCLQWTRWLGMTTTYITFRTQHSTLSRGISFTFSMLYIIVVRFSWSKVLSVLFQISHKYRRYGNFVVKLLSAVHRAAEIKHTKTSKYMCYIAEPSSDEIYLTRIIKQELFLPRHFLIYSCDTSHKNCIKSCFFVASIESKAKYSFAYQHGCFYNQCGGHFNYNVRNKVQYIAFLLDLQSSDFKLSYIPRVFVVMATNYDTTSAIISSRMHFHETNQSA